jgi:hypothetical protein
MKHAAAMFVKCAHAAATNMTTVGIEYVQDAAHQSKQHSWMTTQWAILMGLAILMDSVDLVDLADLVDVDLVGVDLADSVDLGFSHFSHFSPFFPFSHSSHSGVFNKLDCIAKRLPKKAGFIPAFLSVSLIFHFPESYFPYLTALRGYQINLTR